MVPGIFLGGKEMPAHRADKLTAISEPIVWIKCESLDVSELYGPSPPVTGIHFLAFYGIHNNRNSKIRYEFHL
jgi:hypothetical protein